MSRTLHSIWCDDIRQEAGNKLSYVGCYSGQMFVPAMPVTLPKLCVAMQAITLAANPFKLIKFRLLKNDDVLAEADVDASEWPAPQMPRLQSPGDDLKIMAQQMFQIFPFQLTEPCVLRARAITEEGEIKGGSLVIAVTAPELVTQAETPKITASEQIRNRFAPYMGLPKSTK